MLETSLKTVRTDMRSLIRDAQDLFREATSSTGVRADELRNKGLGLLDDAVDKVQEVQAAVLESGREVVESADDYVRRNPWQAIAISAGVGLVVGALLARR
jgi:ElaB/YqjD/DUF883 family membrane-anchored ribosome-binding protein